MINEYITPFSKFDNLTNAREQENVLIELLAISIFVAEKFKDYTYLNYIQYEISDLKKCINKNTHNDTDYRNKYPKTFHCQDGHYVRSKAERDIITFFFKIKLFTFMKNNILQSTIKLIFLIFIYLIINFLLNTAV